MSNAGTQMAGMAGSAAPMSRRTSYRAVAGSYVLTLTLGPAEAMLTPAQARHSNVRSGEVMLDSMMPGAIPMGGVQHHLELRIKDRAMGMAVTNAHVTVSIQRAGAPHGLLTLARMYGVKEGMKDCTTAPTSAWKRSLYGARARRRSPGRLPRARLVASRTAWQDRL